MAIDFNDKVLVTNPTAFHLGLFVLGVGITVILGGAITSFTGDFLLPATAWCVFGVPPSFIGAIVMKSGLTRN